MNTQNTLVSVQKAGLHVKAIASQIAVTLAELPPDAPHEYRDLAKAVGAPLHKLNTTERWLIFTAIDEAMTMLESQRV